MGTVGDSYEKSPMESFWGSIQIELLERKKWTTVTELSKAMADYIENFYNGTRLRSSPEYLTPNEYDLQMKTTAASALNTV